MKKGLLFIAGCIVALGITYASLNASSGQEYKMDQALCAKFMKLSRDSVTADNLPLALAYAQKAIQANSWDKLAWANYNDIVQKMADNGDIPDFGAVVESSKAQQGPKAGAGAAQLEGC